MIIKTKDVDRRNKPIYKNILTGESGTLPMTVEPSDRRQTRHRDPLVPKVRTNRKSTRGRKVYYQTIPNNPEKNQPGRTIKHIQETNDAIKRKSLLFEFFENIRSKFKND